jgi:hypothetical protein
MQSYVAGPYTSLAKKWDKDYRGTYVVAAYGFENDAAWALIHGARESLVFRNYVAHREDPDDSLS